MTKPGDGIPAVGRSRAREFKRLEFRFLVAIDVEAFSQRGAAEQALAQDGLERAVAQAALEAGLDRQRWYRQPRGDGELAVLPEGADGLSLVCDYPRRLAAAIAAVNQAGDRQPRLRVRMAIHHGAVAPGRFGYGPVGMAPVAISRLVDAEIVRQQLRQHSDLDVALIVSATVYDEVIQSRLHGLRPEAFHRTIVRVKGISYVGYVYQDTVSQSTSPTDTKRRPATV
jgi:class 3 adenylate cyclase